MGETVLSGLLRAGWNPTRSWPPTAGRSGRSSSPRSTASPCWRTIEAVADGRHGDLGGQAAGHGAICWPRSRDVDQARTRWWSRWPPGWTPPRSRPRLADGVAVVRVMPNTPAQVDEGMAAISAGSHSDQDHLDRVTEILSATGRVRHRAGALPGRGDRDLRVGAGVPVLRRRGDDRGRRPPRACPATSPPSWWCRPCSARPSCCARPASIPRCCASGSPRRAAPPRPPYAQLEDHKVRAAFIGAMEAARDRSRELAAAAAPGDDRHGQGAAMSGLLVFSEELTRYDFGPDHPMAPGRVTQHHLAGRPAGRAGPARPSCRRRRSTSALLETVHTADYIAAVQPRRAETRRTGWAPATTRSFRACTRSRPPSPWPRVEAARRVWTGEVAAGQQHQRRAAPRDARAAPAGSASTTTSPWPSAGCWTTAASGSATSTSTCTTATACRRSSTTTRG